MKGDIGEDSKLVIKYVSQKVNLINSSVARVLKIYESILLHIIANV